MKKTLNPKNTDSDPSYNQQKRAELRAELMKALDKPVREFEEGEISEAFEKRMAASSFAEGMERESLKTGHASKKVLPNTKKNNSKKPQ